MDSILRPTEAAQYLSVKKGTLYSFVRKGKLEKPIKLGERASGCLHSLRQEREFVPRREPVPSILHHRRMRVKLARSRNHPPPKRGAH